MTFPDVCDWCGDVGELQCAPDGGGERLCSRCVATFPVACVASEDDAEDARPRRTLPPIAGGSDAPLMFRLEINTANAAFHDDDSGEATSASLGVEIGRILRTLAGRLENPRASGDEGRLYDHNGNRVGSWRLEWGQTGVVVP